MRTRKAIFFILFVCSVNAYSETDSSIVGDGAAFQEDVQSDNPANSASSGNSMSQGILKETMADSNTVTENKENDSRGREYKAEDSKNTGNKGAAVAAATGAALIARGTPMLASPIAAVRAAGADLVAKGGLELAQAAADKKSANANGGQEKLLTQNYDEGRGGGAPTGGSSETPGASNTELDKLLESRGIDAAAFNEALASGSMSTSQDILKALGEDVSGYSAEDLASAGDMSNSVLSDVFGKFGAPPEPNGRDPRLSQNMDEGNGKASSVAPEGNIGGAGAGGLAGVGAIGSTSQVNGSLSPIGVGKGATGGMAPTESHGLEDLVNGGKNFLSNLFGLDNAQGNSATSAAASKNLTEAQLRKLGITKQRRGNIFQMASQNFRSFKIWRSKPVQKLARQ